MRPVEGTEGRNRLPWSLSSGMRKESSTPGPDARVGRLAQGDHGVLTTAELIRCGLTPSGIHRRLRAGRLHRVYRGVYAVGHPALSRAGRWLAAVKACGAAAVMSHQSAAALWELLPRYAGSVHVTVPATRKLRQRGISVHRSRTLTRRDTTPAHGIPVTTPTRTLLDLKRILPREEWEAAIDQARTRGIDPARRSTRHPPEAHWNESSSAPVVAIASPHPR